MDPRLQALPAAELAELLNTDQASEALWSTWELADILRHQLDVPLERGMLSLACTDVSQITALRLTAVPPITTMRSLLEHPSPPLALLEAVKDFAKECRNHPDRGLPAKLSTAIYLACIARSATVSKSVISTLERSDLLDGLHWLQEQPWADPCVRDPASALIQLLQS